jgi:hypothetical protein
MPTSALEQTTNPNVIELHGEVMQALSQTPPDAIELGRLAGRALVRIEGALSDWDRVAYGDVYWIAEGYLSDLHTRQQG